MENLETWRKAGRIAAEALEYGRTLIKNGANIMEMCDKVDQKVIDLGAKPAWPAQVGVDAVAAHATPDQEDEAVFDNNVVCLDVGAHIDGIVGDNAVTVDLSGKYAELLKASEDALNNAIKIVRSGVQLGEIGRTIQETIEGYGFQPVRNLSGHGISPWVIHDKPSVPNFDTKDTRTLQGDQIIAIEPFATDGAGMIYEADQGNLFALVQKKPVRSLFARQILQFIEKEYGALPFTTRWLTREFGLAKANFALNELQRLGMLHAYPPLIERQKGMVSVFEKTMYVSDDGAEITTKL